MTASEHHGLGQLPASRDPADQLQAIRQLAAMPDPDMRFIIMLERLRYTTHDAVKNAVKNLLEYLYKTLPITDLAEVMREGDPGAKFWIVRPLGRRGGTQAITLITVIENDCEPENLAYAAEALGKIGGEAAVAAVVRALATYWNEGVERVSPVGEEYRLVSEYVITALVTVDHPSVAPVVVGLLEHPENNVRWTAAKVLKARPDSCTVMDQLEALAMHPDPNIQCCAVEVLKVVKSHRETEPE